MGGNEHGDEADAKSSGLDFGFGLDEDVSAGAAALGTFGAKEGGNRVDVTLDKRE